MVLLGISFLGFSTRGFPIVNFTIAAGWVLLAGDAIGDRLLISVDRAYPATEPWGAVYCVSGAEVDEKVEPSLVTCFQIN